jgi:condensation domain-containing protein
LIEIDAYIRDGQLQVQWAYSRNVHERKTIEQVGSSFVHQLSMLVAHCASRTQSEYTHSDFPLIKLTDRQLQRLQNRYGHIEDIYPLSPIQQGMLFHSLFEPRKGTYLTQLVCELTGDLNQEAFCGAWQQVVNKYSSLRACFEEEIVSDEPVQVIVDSIAVKFHSENWSDLDEAKRKEKLAEFLGRDHEQGIDLKTPPLMRFALFKTAAAHHLFIWTSHHLLMDGWSLPIILKDVFAAYEEMEHGRPVQIQAESPYKEYIGWLKEQNYRDAEAFWRNLLAGFTAPVSLQTLHSHTATSKAENFTEHQIRLPQAITERLQTTAREHQLTVSALAHGAWAILLSSYTGISDVVFGTVVSGRPAEITDVESMVGVFINTLPVRVRVSGKAGLITWIKQLQMQQAEVGQFGHIPLGQVQSWSELPSRTRLFESILVVENYPEIDAAHWLGNSPGGIQITDIRAFERSNYPVTVWLMPGREISLKIGYDASHLDSGKMTKLLNDYRALLEAIAGNPKRSVNEVLDALNTAPSPTSKDSGGTNVVEDAPAYSASAE